MNAASLAQVKMGTEALALRIAVNKHRSATPGYVRANLLI